MATTDTRARILKQPDQRDLKTLIPWLAASNHHSPSSQSSRRTPDKTMSTSLVLATRRKNKTVRIGAASVFVVHVVIAVTVGVLLFRIVPRRALEGVTAAIFRAGGLLVIREAVREQRRYESTSALVAKKIGAHRQTRRHSVCRYLPG
jgi:hypothetical protein